MEAELALVAAQYGQDSLATSDDELAQFLSALGAFVKSWQSARRRLTDVQNKSPRSKPASSPRSPGDAARRGPPLAKARQTAADRGARRARGSDSEAADHYDASDSVTEADTARGRRAAGPRGVPPPDSP